MARSESSPACDFEIVELMSMTVCRIRLKLIDHDRFREDEYAPSFSVRHSQVDNSPAQHPRLR